MSEWQPIETAPKDKPVLVWFDHDADPYHDTATDKLTNYACHAEGGEFCTGKGIAIAQWCESYSVSEGWESGISYWMPEVWFAQLDGDNSDYVVNALFWQPLPEPPQ